MQSECSGVSMIRKKLPRIFVGMTGCFRAATGLTINSVYIYLRSKYLVVMNTMKDGRIKLDEYMRSMLKMSLL